MKTALLYSHKDALWVSVETIRSNLLESYKISLSGSSYAVFSYHKDISGSEVNEMAKKLKTEGYERIVFIDDYPTPGRLLQALALIWPGFDGEIILHVYGSFLLRANDWQNLNDYLTGKKVKLIVSSMAHKKLVDTFLAGNNSSSICFSPIDKSMYGFSPDKRKEARLKYNLSGDETVLLYTGRISLQKNILFLIREVVRFKKLTGKKVKLLLAGNFDDHGAPFFNIETPAGYYFQHFDRLLGELSGEERDTIGYLNYLSKDELLEVMNASDIYINLSTFHCENYGIAPLEALATGMPAILTSWGGFNSFGEDTKFCRMVGVSLKENGLFIDGKGLHEEMEYQANNPVSAGERTSLSKLIGEKYSIESASKVISGILNDECPVFLGLGYKLNLMVKALTVGLEMPSSETFYSEIFSSYLKEESNG